MPLRLPAPLLTRTRTAIDARRRLQFETAAPLPDMQDGARERLLPCTHASVTRQGADGRTRARGPRPVGLSGRLRWARPTALLAGSTRRHGAAQGRPRGPPRQQPRPRTGEAGPRRRTYGGLVRVACVRARHSTSAPARGATAGTEARSRHEHGASPTPDAVRRRPVAPWPLRRRTGALGRLAGCSSSRVAASHACTRAP